MVDLTLVVLVMMAVVTKMLTLPLLALQAMSVFFL
jgi:hypothetical protein